jgi:ABC-type lipoprotein release transport system permease subunit
MSRGIFYLSKKKLYSRENKTFLAVLSIALLISIQVFSYAIVESLGAHFQNLLYPQASNIFYLFNGTATNFSDSNITLDNNSFEGIIAEHIIPILSLEARINNTEVEFRASNSSIFNFPNFQIAGKKEIINNEIVIGNVLARLFNFTIGKEIEVKINNKELKFIIVGLVTSYTSFDYSIISSLDYIWKMFKELNNKISYAIIISNIKEQNLAKSFSERFGNKFKIITNERDEIIDKVFSGPIEVLNVWTIFLLLAISILAFLFTVNNLRRMKNYYAILLSLGMTRKKIFLSILLEGIFIGIMGYIFGVSIGIIFASSFIKFMSALTNIPLSLELDYTVLFQNSSFALIGLMLGYLASLLWLRKEIMRLFE